jgi:hypothetical protein
MIITMPDLRYQKAYENNTILEQNKCTTDKYYQRGEIHNVTPKNRPYRIVVGISLILLAVFGRSMIKY